jgi:hypothetical protein
VIDNHQVVAALAQTTGDIGNDDVRDTQVLFGMSPGGSNAVQRPKWLRLGLRKQCGRGRTGRLASTRGSWSFRGKNGWAALGPFLPGLPADFLPRPVLSLPPAAPLRCLSNARACNLPQTVHQLSRLVVPAGHDGLHFREGSREDAEGYRNGAG